MRVIAEYRPLVVEAPYAAQLGRYAGFSQPGYRHARIVLGEDVVQGGIQFVVIHAQAGDQAEFSIGKIHLILHIHADLGGLGDREVTHRKTVLSHHVADHAGGQVGGSTVALALAVADRGIQAIGQVMHHFTRIESLEEGALQSIQALVEVVLHHPARVVAAQLEGALGGFAVLPIDLPVQAVGEADFQRIDFMLQGDARTGLVVTAGLVQDAGGKTAGACTTGVGINAAAVFVGIHHQLEALVFAGRVDQLAQQAATVIAHRIGRGAQHRPAGWPRLRQLGTVVLALVLHFTALAMPGHDHATPMLATECRGRAAEQALAFTLVPQLEAEVGVLALFQIIGRILGDISDHAAQRIGTIE